MSPLSGGDGWSGEYRLETGSRHIAFKRLSLLNVRGVDPTCFSGSGIRTHPLFRRIGIGLTHFLRWIVYYCVCIQHDIDKSQLGLSFIELCKTLRRNSGLRATNSCLHLFWPQLCNRNIISPADCGVWTHPHFTQIYAPAKRLLVSFKRLAN